MLLQALEKKATRRLDEVIRFRLPGNSYFTFKCLSVQQKYKKNPAHKNSSSDSLNFTLT